MSDTTTTIDMTINSIESTVFDQLFTINITEKEINEPLMPSYKWAFLLLGLLVFTGGFGNILVCLAIGFERRLQNATNYFLLSLAVADLLVSVVVMPFGILNEFYGIWPFGSSICNLWVTCDVLCCSSSILHMCFISVGRYVGIKNPLHARQAPLLVSRRAVLLKISFAWLLSAVITSPLTIMAVFDKTNIQPEPLVCAISSRPFQILGSLSAFFCPMIVMLSSYVLTVRLLRRKAKFYEDSCHNFPTTHTSDNEFIESHNRFKKTTTSSSSGKEYYLGNRTVSLSSTSSANSATSGNLQLMVNQCSVSQYEMSCTDSHLRPINVSHNNLSVKRWDSDSNKSELTNHKKKHTNRKTQPLMLRTLGSSLQVRNEQKATKVLGLVFFAFVICWAPFFSLNFMFGVMPNPNIPDEVTTTFLWLGYISSIINPIIYTIFNRNFRRAFKRIILCQICANDSVPKSRRFSRTASQTRDTTHKRCSASPVSPARQTSRLCDISTSFNESIHEVNDSNNHKSQSQTITSAHYK
ncbi:5-hydroxytryptamine receptor 2B-like [Oppia nitens]|uniref:5-hydroxytryptamine receptor 2B-like n=1 Tax=Oppia nitens TaxID=1686743 RepID=UPI0023DC2F57|nr:5-hydroxytryptamine receptor 2B-like [Oppia nitens]